MVTLAEYKKWCDEELDPLCKQEGTEFEAQTLVNKKLAEVLSGRKVEYLSTDWKDVSSLIDDILNTDFDLRHSSKKVYEPFAEAEHGGSDDYVLIAISGEASDDELDVVFDLIHNLGAELPELPPGPRCPKCGEAIDCLVGGYPTTVPVEAHVIDGELSVDIVDGIKVRDTIDGEVESWYCPNCDEQLFKAGEGSEMVRFLKGEACGSTS